MPKTADFDKLKKLWYSKLKASGFDDIETDEYNLKVWSSDFRLTKSIHRSESKESYYHMATTFLNDHTFDTDLEKLVWEYHASGVSTRNIAEILKKNKVRKMGRYPVWSIIRKLETAMKKMYLVGYKDE